MQLRNTAGSLLLCLLPMLGGCFTSLTAYPDPSWDARTELGALEPYLSADAITRYDALDDEARNGMDRRNWRNAVVNARIRAMDVLFNEFQQELYQEGGGLGIATEMRALAGSLQVPADEAVLTNLLLAISGAQSEEAFDLISQKMRIHFGKEF